MGIYFDDPSPDVINSEALSDWINSVGNDTINSFFAASIGELVGRGIASLQLNPDQTIAGEAHKLGPDKYSSLDSNTMARLPYLSIPGYPGVLGPCKWFCCSWMDR